MRGPSKVITLSTSQRNLWTYSLSWPLTTQREITRRKHKMRDGRPMPVISRVFSPPFVTYEVKKFFVIVFLCSKFSILNRSYIQFQLRKSGCAQGSQHRVPISMHIGWATRRHFGQAVLLTSCCFNLFDFVMLPCLAGREAVGPSKPAAVYTTLLPA